MRMDVPYRECLVFVGAPRMDHTVDPVKYRDHDAGSPRSKDQHVPARWYHQHEAVSEHSWTHIRASFSCMQLVMKTSVDETVFASGEVNNRLGRYDVKVQQRYIQSNTYSKTSCSSGRARYVFHNFARIASLPVARFDNACMSILVTG